MSQKAMFVYEAARLQAIAVDAPIVPEVWAERMIFEGRVNASHITQDEVEELKKAGLIK